VVEYTSDWVGVMYLGRMVGFASAERIYDNPRMPYARALLSATPDSERTTGRKRIVLKGDVPSPLDPPLGCPFRTRCWLAEDVCAAELPSLREVAPEHFAACHFAEDPERLTRDPDGREGHGFDIAQLDDADDTVRELEHSGAYDRREDRRHDRGRRIVPASSPRIAD
jgi:oligopeptide/dipeptide ABC transporter ATP-binding protein